MAGEKRLRGTGAKRTAPVKSIGAVAPMAKLPPKAMALAISPKLAGKTRWKRVQVLVTPNANEAWTS